MNKKTLLTTTTTITTILFGLNLIIPLYTSAQENSTIGQNITSDTNSLTILCAHSNITLDEININSTNPTFNAYWENPKTPENIERCDGTGITVKDTRYNGGFILQVQANDYTKLGDATKTISADNIGVITQKINPSYNENSNNTSTFTNTGDTLITSSAGDDIEVQYSLPFDFTYYGTTYTTGTTIYLCSNGTINFTTNQCSTLPTNASDILTDNHKRILPYYKDLTTTNGGIYYKEDLTPTAPAKPSVTFRWDAENKTSQTVDFSTKLTNDGTSDTITFDYDSSIQDTDQGPIIGTTKGGAIPENTTTSTVYTESVYSNIDQGGQYTKTKQLIFTPAGFDFTEVKKPGTKSATAPYNSNETDIKQATFEDLPTPDHIVNILNATDYASSGRVGIYTLYPSFRLKVPQATEAGTYTNTITYTLIDSTDA